jgi:hypothetical protein
MSRGADPPLRRHRPNHYRTKPSRPGPASEQPISRSTNHPLTADFGVEGHRFLPSTREPARIAAMSMEMVGNLAHDPVNGGTADPEAAIAGPGQTFHHVIHVGIQRLGSVPFPYNHRRRAHLAVGHPADIVLEVPVGVTGGLAEITPLNWVFTLKGLSNI